MTIEWGKLGLLLVMLVGSFTLQVTGRIDEGLFSSVLFAVLGYTVGNGALASKGKPTVPMIGRDRDPSTRERATDHGS